jgi:hypothetical protein
MAKEPQKIGEYVSQIVALSSKPVTAKSAWLE